jgi:hypothetical protein
MNIAEQVKHLVFLSLDHFDHHWDLRHSAAVLRGVFAFTPELLERSNFEKIVKIFRKASADVRDLLFGLPTSGHGTRYDADQTVSEASDSIVGCPTSGVAQPAMREAGLHACCVSKARQL